MSDIIKLLPDSVSNQIAAGEVIQRPASAVKELLENAIDSGATEIILIVKDSGKTLIQVTDNGCGMSETDARLCFERHATSKIREAGDLFAIRTLGFRGEALASIAAISQVELKTKRTEDELGVCIEINGSVVKDQQPCQCTNGSSFSVKNLFYNVPARRNFLKSDAAEMNNIIEDFQRVALVNHGISMSLFHNGKIVHKLEAENLKQRIISIFGANYAQKLVQVETMTDMANITGYICKPEFAKKKRGEQYFFVNGRFIKHAYLNYAVNKAFEELIPGDSFPSYFIYFNTDPKTIDINIHPTKTEVKFEDEKSMFMILRSAIRQALGKYSITPSIDFDIEKSFNFPEPTGEQDIKAPEIKTDPNFNPFKKTEKWESGKPGQSADARKGLDQWEKLYDLSGVDIKPKDDSTATPEEKNTELFSVENIEEPQASGFLQLRGEYTLTQIKSGLMIMHQQTAHERILFERLMESMENERTGIQQQLFPQTLSFPASDSELLLNLHDELYNAGFDLEEFGPNTFIVNGVPTDMEDDNVQGLLEGVLESYKKNLSGMEGDKRTRLAASLARQMSVKCGKALSTDEMRSLVDQLFACSVPNISPSGKRTFIMISYDELDQKFKQSVKK